MNSKSPMSSQKSNEFTQIRSTHKNQMNSQTKQRNSQKPEEFTETRGSGKIK